MDKMCEISIQSMSWYVYIAAMYPNQEWIFHLNASICSVLVSRGMLIFDFSGCRTDSYGQRWEDSFALSKVTVFVSHQIGRVIFKRRGLPRFRDLVILEKSAFRTVCVTSVWGERKAIKCGAWVWMHAKKSLTYPQGLWWKYLTHVLFLHRVLCFFFCTTLAQATLFSSLFPGHCFMAADHHVLCKCW